MVGRTPETEVSDEPRSLQFLTDGPRIPLDLIRARDAGDVVFIVGAGASKGSGFPLFWELTQNVYLKLSGKDPDKADRVPRSVHKAYKANAFDFVLGHLEREIDGGQLDGRRPRRVRQAVADALIASDTTPFDRHQSLMILARDPRGEPRIVTTNFDTLLERAWPVTAASVPLKSRAGADLPGPGTIDFRGVLHLHGRLRDGGLPAEITATDLVLTDADFGDAYLRSGWAARFLYDLVRRYTLVLVGYGAEDPPLKYLLSVIGADRSRFSDLKAIYAFVDTAPNEADDVTGEWLAKGISPLLYERDPTHGRLYDTLAEWARLVDDPVAWAEDQIESIGSKQYDECANHERSLLELLLLSPGNCAKAKSKGAAFSWIRAIEASRPSTSTRPADTTHFVSPSDSYIAAFTAWTHKNLHSMEAAAWAVERLSPPPYRPRVNGDLGGEGLEISRRIHAAQGISTEELEFIDRQIRFDSDDWKREYIVFWGCVLRCARSRANIFHDFAYDLLRRQTKFEADPINEDALQLAKFLAPGLRIEHPFRWDPSADGEESPLNLARFAFNWKGHPGHLKISAALPNHAPWLIRLLHLLSNQLTDLYVVSEDVGQLGPRDWLSYGCRRVLTEQAWHVDDGDGDSRSDPDWGSSDHLALVRVISSAWMKLAALDDRAARGIAIGWSYRPEELFRRLFIASLSQQNTWSPEEICHAFLDLSENDFWRPLPEVLISLTKIWHHLTEKHQIEIEARILGLPKFEASDFESIDAKLLAQRDAAAKFLIVILESGGAISAEAQDFIAATHSSDHGHERSALDELLPSGPRVYRAPEVRTSELADLEGKDLLSALISDFAGDWFRAGDKAETVIRSSTNRVFQALLDFGDPSKHQIIWKKILWMLREPQWTEGAAAKTKVRVLQAIQEMPPILLDEAGNAAADWLQEIAVGPDEKVMPFFKDNQGLILGAWRHLANHAFKASDLEKFGPNQGEHLMSRALNREAGTVAFIGLVLADRGNRQPEVFSLLAAAQEEIDQKFVRAAPGARALVAARLSEWLAVAERVLPQATEELVMRPLEIDPPELSLLDLNVLFGHGLSEQQYKRLEPLMLLEARRARLSQQGTQYVVGRLIFRFLNRLAGYVDSGPADADLRSVLQRSTADVRASAAHVCRDWFTGYAPHERAALWAKAGRPFFSNVWPLDAALRHPAVSQELLRLPAAVEQCFDEAVAQLIPLTVPYQLYDLTSIFLALERSEDEYDSIKETARDFASRHWGAFLDLLDAAVGPAPSNIPYELAEWLDDLGERIPETRKDPRFKRMYRLTQQ